MVDCYIKYMIEAYCFMFLYTLSLLLIVSTIFKSSDLPYVNFSEFLNITSNTTHSNNIVADYN